MSRFPLFCAAQSLARRIIAILDRPKWTSDFDQLVFIVVRETVSVVFWVRETMFPRAS